MNLLALFLLTSVVAWAGLALAAAALVRLGESRLAALAPDDRARWLTRVALAPASLGLAMAALCFVPGAVGLLWPALDHCLYHGHGDHPALCALHIQSLGVFGWLVVTTLAVAVARPVWRARRLRAAVRHLEATAHLDARLGVHRVESDAAFALATERKILLSSGLLQRLAAPLVGVVIAHERAHLARRDARRLRWVRRALLLWLPGARRQVLRALELACEQACDEAAAAVVGDRVRVAQALLAAERLLGAHPLPGLPAFGGSALTERVEALLAPPAAAPDRTRTRLLLLALALGLPLLTDWLHHALEAAVGWLRLL